MATSIIKTGLRLVKIPNSSFSWNSSNFNFTTNKSNADATTGLTTIIDYIVSAPTSNGAILGVGTNTSGTQLIISGWNAKTGTHITEDYANAFNCYAIGY